MGLMKMELVVLQCPVLDGPVLNRALSSDDGRWISGAVESALLPVDSYKEKRFGIVLRKIKMASVGDLSGS